MDKSELIIQKQKTLKYPKKKSKNQEMAELRLKNKKNFHLSSRRGLSNESQKSKFNSLVHEGFDSGINHLEYLKEKNSLARKRLLDLQKRLMEIKSKEKAEYCVEEFKLPHVLDQVKDSETLSLIQKYSSVNLGNANKTFM